MKDIEFDFGIQRTPTGFDGVTAFPYHGADRAAQHVC